MYWGVYDDYTIRYIKPKGNNAILIRILEPYYKKSGIPYEIYNLNKYSDVLELYFEDINEEPPKEYANRFILFDEQMAKQLTEFILNHNFDEINIHCNSGQSRSSSIMICVSRILNKKHIEDEINNDNKFKPNPLVLSRFTNYQCNKKNIPLL